MAAADVLQAVPWVLPPVLGALIGYLTNALAIRMLFRPLRAWRVFGLRVPLTPGVIPRRRAELAESIARMVSRELLTTEVFETRFASDEFRRSLQRVIVQALDSLGSRTVSEVRETFALDRLLDGATAWTKRALCGSEVAVEAAARAAAEELARRADDLALRAREAAAEMRPLGVIDPQTARAFVERVWPELVGAAQAAVQSDPIQAEIYRRARRILHYSLDELTSLQRLFVSAAQYDRRLESRLPAIVGRITRELCDAIESERTRKRVEELVFGRLETHAHDSLGDLVGPEGLAAVQTAVAGLLSDRGRTARVISQALEALSAEDGCAELVDRGGGLIRRALDRRDNATVSGVVPVIRRRRATIARETVAWVQPRLHRLADRFTTELDVHSVVVARINDLDVRRVEELLLGIIRRHLTWINAFGAVLGALIGAVQILLRLMGLA